MRQSPKIRLQLSLFQERREAFNADICAADDYANALAPQLVSQWSKQRCYCYGR
jgi:hypothetical protein